MKHLLFIFLILQTYTTIAQQNVQRKHKLSPQTQQYLFDIKKAGDNHKILPDYVYKKTATGVYLSGMIKVNAGIEPTALESLGVRVGTKAGSIWTVQVPQEKVEAFTALPGIDYIDLDAPVSFSLDSARRVTHADSVQEGKNLPMPYTGKNVVVGIVDAGFDFTHPTLYDTLGATYRVKRLWQQKDTAGTPPSGFSYGRELTDPFAIMGAQTDQVFMSHGMHVTGIAAGSGFGSYENRRYRGMAYQSDIVLVSIMPDSSEAVNTGLSDMIDGINYIFNYAFSVGEPAVVNLSWGLGISSHDGTSLFSQACDSLTGAGKIFVCAAGNNGTDSIHLAQTFTPTDTMINSFIAFSPYLDFKKTVIDMWGDSGSTFCVQISLYNDTTGLVTSSGFICLDDTLHNITLVGSNGDTCFVTMLTSSSEFNNEPRAFMRVYSRVTDSVCVSVKGTAGTVNIWNGGYVYKAEGYTSVFTNGGKTWGTVGNTITSVSDLATTKSAIAAGAYVSKTDFTNTAGGSYTYTYGGYHIGHLADFSSHGPTIDGRVTPFITAPGLAVASSINSFDTTFIPGGSNFIYAVTDYKDPANSRDYYYAVLSGTSMATPVTTGIIALMLEANPTLTPDETKNILMETAIQDKFTGKLPATGTNTWGHGKINAYQAMRSAAGVTTVKNLPGISPDCILFPNPNHGAFTLDYIGAKDETLITSVYDITGKTIFTENWKVTPGDNRKDYTLPSLTQGIYFIKVSSGINYTVMKMTVY